MKRIIRTGLGGLISSLLIMTNIFAEPPFLTNDTDVALYKQFQFYLFSMSDRNVNGTLIQAPSTVINWGGAPNWEAFINVSNNISLPSDEPNALGLGDSGLGFEYRFWQESAYSPAIAIAPQLTIPTGNASRNLGNGTPQMQLPIWFQKSFSSWTIDTGGGYNFNSAVDTFNNGFAGFLLQKQLNERLTLGGEIFYQGAVGVGNGEYTVLNLGGTFNFTPNFSLMFSVGNSIAGQQNFISYLGLYWQTEPPRTLK